MRHGGKAIAGHGGAPSREVLPRVPCSFPSLSCAVDEVRSERVEQQRADRAGATIAPRVQSARDGGTMTETQAMETARVPRNLRVPGATTRWSSSFISMFDPDGIARTCTLLLRHELDRVVLLDEEEVVIDARYLREAEQVEIGAVIDLHLWSGESVDFS